MCAMFLYLELIRPLHASRQIAASPQQIQFLAVKRGRCRPALHQAARHGLLEGDPGCQKISEAQSHITGNRREEKGKQVAVRRKGWNGMVCFHSAMCRAVTTWYVFPFCKILNVRVCVSPQSAVGGRGNRGCDIYSDGFSDPRRKKWSIGTPPRACAAAVNVSQVSIV